MARDSRQQLIVRLWLIAMFLLEPTFGQTVPAEGHDAPGAPSLAISSDTRAGGTATDPGKAPMPPTIVRIDSAPAAELVDRVFGRSGISKEARSLLGNATKQMSDSDLTYLAKGGDPLSMGLEIPDSVTSANDA